MDKYLKNLLGLSNIELYVDEGNHCGKDVIILFNHCKKMKAQLESERAVRDEAIAGLMEINKTWCSQLILIVIDKLKQADTTEPIDSKELLAKHLGMAGDRDVRNGK